MAKDNSIIAIMYDFDKTLSTTDMQNYSFIPALNMTPEEFQGYCKGNIIKYACRCGRKDDPLKEALKIVDYANWLVLSLQGKIINPHKEEEVKE